METSRIRNGKLTTFEDSRTRPAIKNPGQRCLELHCSGNDVEHAYSSRACDWVQLEDGSIMSRRDANETSTRPDRLK